MISSNKLTALTEMISIIDDNFNDFPIHEIIINVCICFMGSPKSLLRLNGRNEMKQSSRFLNSLRKLMTKIINIVNFEEILENLEGLLDLVDISTVTYVDEPTLTFEMSWYFLCIIQDLYHKVRYIRSIEPAGDIEEYSTLILPALLVLEDGFMVLRNRIYDFICSQFYTFEDFQIANDRERVFVDNDYLPLHPCNGPLGNSLIEKAGRIQVTLTSQIRETKYFQCENCLAGLLNLSRVAVWDGCQHWGLCVDCAEKVFFGFISHDSIDELTDGNVAATLQSKSKKCPSCSSPITKWTKGEYIIVSFQKYEIVPSPYPGQYFDRWYVNLFHRIKIAILSHCTISYILALLFQPLPCYLGKLREEDPETHARMHNVFFNGYKSLLERLPVNLNVGSRFLAAINLICIEEAFECFAQLIGSSVRSDLNLDTLSVIQAIRRKVVLIRNAIMNNII